MLFVSSQLMQVMDSRRDASCTAWKQGCDEIANSAGRNNAERKKIKQKVSFNHVCSDLRLHPLIILFAK